MTSIRCILLLLIISTPIVFHGQDYEVNKSYYKWFDQEIGIQNLQIYNGTAYVEKYRTINEKHKFFNSSTFLPGSLIYNGQPFYDLQLKYDCYEDVVLLNSKIATGTVIRLNSNKIKSFIVDSHEFINLSLGQNDQRGIKVTGFYEVLFQTPFFMLLQKNKKNLLKKIKGKLVYYEFKSDFEKYLLYKNTYYPIRKKRDLIRIFPELKKNINSYYTTSRDNSDSAAFMKGLLMNIELELK